MKLDCSRHISLWAKTLAAHAKWALEQEVLLTPKPGLVDSSNSGAHSDLSLQIMLNSAQILMPYFEKMALEGCKAQTTIKLREAIGQIGRDAEAAMLNETNGINTHRGAIWALGLLITVAARNKYQSLNELCSQAGDLALTEDKFAPIWFSKGKTACKKYNVGGAKSQAQQGFPIITKYALPTLLKSREQHLPECYCRLNSLLSIMANLDDTCILSRAGPSGLYFLKIRSKYILSKISTSDDNTIMLLKELDQDMIKRNISPGGSADLLAATLFIDKLNPTKNQYK